MERDRFDLPHPYVCLSTGYFSFSFTRAKLLLLGRRKKKIEAKDQGLRVRKKDEKKGSICSSTGSSIRSIKEE